MSGEYWCCAIGPMERSRVPDGGDFPMRQAVRHEFMKMFSEQEKVLSSGWGYQEPLSETVRNLERQRDELRAARDKLYVELGKAYVDLGKARAECEQHEQTIVDLQDDLIESRCELMRERRRRADLQTKVDTEQ